jgi:GNAT superfamily N-acetyltransferase
VETITNQASLSEPSSFKRGEPATSEVEVRQAKIRDIPGIRQLFQKCYTHEPPPYLEGLFLAQRVFPQGQFVAIADNKVVGYASSLLLDSEFDFLTSDWNTLTAWGTLANHDPEGDFLYAAEVLVDKDLRGKGIGKKLYQQRDRLATELLMNNPDFKGIAATSRLSGYSRHFYLTPEKYLEKVILGEIQDPTLSFQLGQGFQVLNLLQDFEDDPETLGWAASIFKKF